MTKENKEKLAKYLKAQPKKWGNHQGRILCFDQVDDRRVEVDFIIDGELFIGGDDGEKYEFSELELIDERVVNF